MDFLNNLEKKMNEKNLNKSQLAKGMGVAPSTVNSWFNRSAENITLKTLKKLADFLDCSIDSLVYYAILELSSDIICLLIYPKKIDVA